MATILKLVPHDELMRAEAKQRKEAEDRAEADRIKVANAATVKLMREWLEMAERGEIVTAVIAGLDADGSELYEIGAFDNSRAVTLLGCIGTVDALLKAKIVADAEADMEDEAQ